MEVSHADIVAFQEVVRSCRRAGCVRITEKAREECAINAWGDDDVYLFLDDLSPKDFRRREAAAYANFDAIWVFTP